MLSNLDPETAANHFSLLIYALLNIDNKRYY